MQFPNFTTTIMNGINKINFPSQDTDGDIRMKTRQLFLEQFLISILLFNIKAYFLDE